MTFSSGVATSDCVVLSHPTGIPQLILLTHVDQVCPSVQKDLKDIYSSHTVQNIVSIYSSNTCVHFLK